MTNAFRRLVEGSTKTENQSRTAYFLERAYVREILGQALPGSAGTVEDALNCLCQYLHPGSNQTPAQICGLVDSLGKVGLRLARSVPGLILGQDEARLYINPRLVRVSYPGLSASPRPFAFTATLDSDELLALEGPSSRFGCEEDWPENNEFERTEVEKSEEEEFVERFGKVLMNQVLPRTEITVAEALERLCAGLNEADESSLENCDSLHMQLEDVGLRFYRYCDKFDHTGLPGKGFLKLENSRQFVRIYPALDWMVPSIWRWWMAMLPVAEKP